jgi:two-component system sensor histidine kinase BaeS
VTLYDATRRVVVGSGAWDSDASRLPLVVDGQTVGWLGLRAITRFDDEVNLKYLREVRSQLILIAAVAILVGLLGGWLLTRRLLRPIDALSAGTRRLTSGDYDARIGLQSDDEFGRLARDFDALAKTLGDDSRARRQWVADTSHELRTPIAVLRGELEALIDGVRAVTPAALESLHAEVARLSKLVEDLGELARSDRGTLTITPAPLELDELLRESVAACSGRFEQRRITLELALEKPPTVIADRLRLQQVFTNLLENSLRYTDAGGVLRISSTSDADWLTLRFDDSAPGVPPEALPRLFERFYRADPSRSRAHGGSGLGLAISQRLVEAHGGTMIASASPLGGLRIELRLPLHQRIHPGEAL